MRMKRHEEEGKMEEDRRQKGEEEEGEENEGKGRNRRASRDAGEMSE